RGRLEVVLGGLEDHGVGPEREVGAGLVSGLAPDQRPGRDAADVRLGPDVAVAADHDGQLPRQRVDHGDADAVQATGHRVPAAAELPAGVEHGHDDLEGGPLLHRVQVDRDAAAVVDHPDAAVVEQRDVDPVAVAGERLVDG